MKNFLSHQTMIHAAISGKDAKGKRGPGDIMDWGQVFKIQEMSLQDQGEIAPSNASMVWRAPEPHTDTSCIYRNWGASRQLVFPDPVVMQAAQVEISAVLPGGGNLLQVPACWVMQTLGDLSLFI